MLEFYWVGCLTHLRFGDSHLFRPSLLKITMVYLSIKLAFSQVTNLNKLL